MGSIERAMDASINRSLEGLRVCEDILRFYCNGKGASELKELRHRLGDAAGTLSRDRLLGSREVEGDQQKFFNTESEFTRSSVSAVFAANIRRAAEAVRSLEEFSKLDPDGAGHLFQEIRFAIYEIEKKSWFALKNEEAKLRFADTLYAIADSGFVSPDETAASVREMALGGTGIIQLRMKNEDRRLVLETARRVRSICSDHDVLFIMNDYPDIAVMAEADGVHLGQDDLPLSEVRKFLPPGMVIGLSTHSPEQARDAHEMKPDYIAIGPVFDTTSKTGTVIKGIGTGMVKEVAAASELPLVAIGGITGENLSSVLEAGCTCPAVISELFKEGRIRANCEALTSLIQKNNI